MFLFHLSSSRRYWYKHGRIPNGALEKSIYPNVRWVPQNGFHVIHTLDPNKFAEKKQQRLNIGGKCAFTPQISLHKQSSPVFPHLQVYYGRTTSLKHAFYPPDTKAFLYYSIPPGKPRIAGELRLRVASSDDLTSFESGSDLLLINGRTWTRPLCTLSNRYLPLYKKLREDHLIPDDLDAFLSTLPSKRLNFLRCNLFHTLHDTFIVDFSLVNFYFLVITEQGLGKLSLQKLFFDTREMCKHTPYTGAYTNRNLSVLQYWLFSWTYRKCLGSIRTFNALRAQRHKDRCVTFSQDNHTCEVCCTLVRWLRMFPKGRRASQEERIRPAPPMERQYWQTKWSYVSRSSITLGYIDYSTLLQSSPFTLRPASGMW